MFEIILTEDLAMIHSYFSNVAPLPKDRIVLPDNRTFFVEDRTLSSTNYNKILLSGTSK